MPITITNLAINTVLLVIVYCLKNTLPRWRRVHGLEIEKINKAWFILSLSVICAGLAWYFPTHRILNVLSSLLALSAMSVFFNTLQEWFKRSQHFKMKKEDLWTLGVWIFWLLSGAMFLANIMIYLMNTN
ncbi:MAG: hypothetical protein V1898_03255 [Patescibacteria group bacterium]